MTVKDIQNKLRYKFDSHKYILDNSYVYDWESDFFSVTASGYAQEIEVKLSISDFKADFKKIEKHEVIQRRFNGEETYLKRTNNNYTYEYEEMTTLLIDGKRQWDEENREYTQVPSGKIKKGEVCTNHIESIFKSKHNFKYEQTSSGIEIKELPKIPNKFYYICPKGLISVESIPVYAGLYYIDEQTLRVTEVKKAPFIHKDKENLDKVLLDKFYYMSLRQK